MHEHTQPFGVYPGLSKISFQEIGLCLDWFPTWDGGKEMDFRAVLWLINLVWFPWWTLCVCVCVKVRLCQIVIVKGSWCDATVCEHNCVFICFFPSALERLLLSKEAGMSLYCVLHFKQGHQVTRVLFCFAKYFSLKALVLVTWHEPAKSQWRNRFCSCSNVILKCRLKNKHPHNKKLKERKKKLGLWENIEF